MPLRRAAHQHAWKSQIEGRVFVTESRSHEGATVTATILLVEDNPITRKLVRFALGQRGYDVVEATDGKSAVRMLVEREPDLVLQDLVLPDVDGFELAGRLRAGLGTRVVPILAFSGFVTKLEEARISAVGFDDLIVKPVEPSRLVQIVQAHLPEPAGQSEHFGQGRRILIADDDPLQGKLAAFRLERLGFEAALVSDGAKALASARQRTPDLVLSDIMMPGVDGFQLCLEIRKDPSLRDVPVVLMTSSYIDEEDRLLARQAGASSFVLRTPSLAEIIDAIRATLVTSAPPPRPTIDHADVEREHTQRVIQQLERQVQMNAGISQRCSLLSAELSILSGISNALTRHQDFDAALDEVLAACFDAGGISTGVLYLFGEAEADSARARAFGMASSWSERTLDTFFGDVEGLRAALDGICVVVPSEDERIGKATTALTSVGVTSALAVPLSYRGELLGALFIASKSEPLGDEDRLAFVTGVAGQIAQAVALLRTFSAKAASERQALETATTLRAMMDSIADGVIVADEEQRVLYSNAAAARLLGDLVESPLGDRPTQARQLLPDQVTPYPPEQLPLGRAIRGERSERVELFVRRSDEAQGAWLSVNAQPVVDSGGRRHGGVAVFRDVTAERSAREQLMVADRMASIGMLAAGVAHEINNPLAAVMGHLDLLSADFEAMTRGLPPGDALHDLSEDVVQARVAADRVCQITRDLKVFARAEEERIAPVDVHAVIDSSVRLAWNEIRHRARLIKDFGVVPRVDASESRLGQVFLNLIVNAAQAIPDGRANANEIRIVTKVGADDQVVVEIRDSGAGIAPNILPEIFTPFVTTKPPGVGTGLGLAICRRILSGIGAKIDATSEQGKGSVFRVTFPPSSRPETPSTGPPIALSVANKAGRILVIDDDAAVLNMVRRALSREHELVLVARASDALAKIVAGEHFDLILCDLMMPHMTGMELHAKVLEVAPAQIGKLIFMTGGAFSPRTRAFLTDLPNTVIEKPFEIARLRALVNERLQGAQ